MFLCFFCTFVISILILSCQNPISLLFIIYLEFWAWFSIINTSKEPKGRFGPFLHFRPLSQKRPWHFGNSAGESSSWNKRIHVSKYAKPAKRWSFSHLLVVLRETVWYFAAQEEHGEVELKLVLSLAHWVAGDSPNHVTKLLQPLEATQEVKDGGRINFLIQGKNFLLLIYIIFLAIILMDESSYISCFTWYLW